MVIKDIEAFLKKKNRKSVIMLENDTEIFQKMKTLVEYRTNYSKM